MANTVYEVFARKARKDPLGHVGSVSAASETFAKVYARNTYDEENWIEMVVVPRPAMIRALDLVPIIDPESGD